MFTRKEIEDKLGSELLLAEKVHYLANGMIKLHGYSKEKAFVAALIMAREMVNI
ncbi:hypothetical protein [Maribacter litoralis]|uniref:hypothetical protein n=1 Tax=Maribacter litoralis TaxID=2059726 RepID=UPI003F5CD039